MVHKKLVNEIQKVEYQVEIEYGFKGKKFDSYMSYEDIYNILTEANRDRDIDDEEYYRKLYELIILGQAIVTLSLDDSQGGYRSMTYYFTVKEVK